MREAQRHREAQRGTERPRVGGGATERHREAQTGTERHRAAQRPRVGGERGSVLPAKKITRFRIRKPATICLYLRDTVHTSVTQTQTQTHTQTQTQTGRERRRNTKRRVPVGAASHEICRDRPHQSVIRFLL